MGDLHYFPKSEPRKYRVTFVETVDVHANTPEEAIGYAEQLRAFAGPDTENIDAEELEEG